MKRLGLLLFLLAIATLLAGSALAQNVGDNSVYFTAYYSNANIYGGTTPEVGKKPALALGVPDSTLRIINDGDAGTLWASIYAFDDSQELQDCCSCPISADGLLSESVNYQLVNFDYVLTPVFNHTGVIKVISSSVYAGGPNYTNTPAPGLHGWITHVQSTKNEYPYGPAPYSQTETQWADSNLSAVEKTGLENVCLYAGLLGSGFGHCSCTTEDYDF
jgi:hypothetical protein